MKNASSGQMQPVKHAYYPKDQLTELSLNRRWNPSVKWPILNKCQNKTGGDVVYTLVNTADSIKHRYYIAPTKGFHVW